VIISRTPFRVSFFGGGTDYPPWFREHGGAFLSVTINRYCYVMARRLPPFFEVRGRISWSMIENVSTLADIRNPVVREVLRYLDLEPAFDIHYHGDLPARSGLGSSSSFCVGLLNAMHALHGRFVGKMALAEQAIKVEQDLIGDTVGVQDQTAAAHGGLNFYTVEPSGQIQVNPVVIGAERLAELENHVMLFYTGVSRSASDIAATQVSNIAARTAELKRIRELVEEAHATLCSGCDITQFGKLLDETWRMKRALSDRVSTSAIDDAYAAAMKAGAVGGKLLGAGGGGFLMVFAPPKKQARVKEALGDLLHVPAQFDRNGSQIIFHDPDQ
jgi:D-glycero-alpha-D-manno-heptose-7-phosphate kinase